MLGQAGVAELANATGLGPVGRKPLEVRVLSPALAVVVLFSAGAAFASSSRELVADGDAAAHRADGGCERAARRRDRRDRRLPRRRPQLRAGRCLLAAHAAV